MGDASITISQKVDLLFEQMRGPDGKRYRYEDVERATGIKPSTISQLRRRTQQDPQFRTVMALARFFGISLAFFATDMTREEAAAYLIDPDNVHYLDEIKERRMQTQAEGLERQRNLLALRAAYLDEAGIEAVTKMIDYILLQRGVQFDEDSAAGNDLETAGSAEAPQQ
jgi:transcriptional regulator with XRE-family HTH domain